MYSVAASMTCFEEQNYGVAAFKRTRKLLHRKWRSAVGLFILIVIPAAIITVPVLVMVEFYGWKFIPDQSFEWTRVLLIASYVVFTSYVTEFQYICWALFYLACVADSEENSIIHREDRLEAGLAARDASVKAPEIWA
ncbi:hypothetical protein R1sor_014640 [Riccia sorocarpa]|uniref:Uncharacterized protein n=1 Tax=Riccia sorocarpa TaxID=122646 RepID=A0ABD3HE75_9MARC